MNQFGKWQSLSEDGERRVVTFKYRELTNDPLVPLYCVEMPFESSGLGWRSQFGKWPPLTEDAEGRVLTLKLLFEAAIWVKIYPVSEWEVEKFDRTAKTMSAHEAGKMGRKPKAGYPSPEQFDREREMESVKVTRSTASKPLEAYWIKRFSGLVENRGTDRLGKVKWLFGKVSSPYISLMRMAEPKAQNERAVQTNEAQ